jgi:hypothetical protein
LRLDVYCPPLALCLGALGEAPTLTAAFDLTYFIDRDCINTLQIASDPRAKLSPGLGEMPGAHRKEGQLARHSEIDDDFSERAGLN